MDQIKNSEFEEKKTSKAKTKKEKELSFEDALTRLQEIANLLENSNPPLATALELYEESASLLKLCTALLEDATNKITVLEKENANG